MEDRAADADDGDRDQDHRVGTGEGEQREADQREPMPAGRTPFTGRRSSAHADQRLEERGGDLEDEGDRPIWKKVSANSWRNTG